MHQSHFSSTPHHKLCSTAHAHAHAPTPHPRVRDDVPLHAALRFCAICRNSMIAQSFYDDGDEDHDDIRRSIRWVFSLIGKTKKQGFTPCLFSSHPLSYGCVPCRAVYSFSRTIPNIEPIPPKKGVFHTWLISYVSYRSSSEENQTTTETTSNLSRLRYHIYLHVHRYLTTGAVKHEKEKAMLMRARTSFTSFTLCYIWLS